MNRDVSKRRRRKKKKNEPLISGAVSEKASYQGTAFSRATRAEKNTPASAAGLPMQQLKPLQFSRPLAASRKQYLIRIADTDRSPQHCAPPEDSSFTIGSRISINCKAQ
jgi:hypothetical protein